MEASAIGQGAAKTLAHNHDHAALAVLVLFQAAVNPVCLVVFRADGATKVSPVNLDMAFQDFPGLNFKRHRFAQLVEKLAVLGIDEKEVNVRNKLSRGKFTAAFFLQCLSAVGVVNLQLGL